MPEQQDDKRRSKSSKLLIHEAAVDLGSRGGTARKSALSSQRRAAIAKKAANVRWHKEQVGVRHYAAGLKRYCRGR